jgi:hypothetical protein
MKLQKTFIKKISFILIVTVLSLNLSFFSTPKKVEAIWGLGDQTFNVDLWEIAWNNFLEPGLKQVVTGVVKQLILKMTQATVDWINGKSGKYPSYVNNIGQFIFARGGVMDQGFGDFFAQNSNLNFLCDPFKAQLIIALNLGYASSSVSQSLGCSYYNVQNNLNNAINNIGSTSVSLSVNGQTSVTNVSSLTNGNSDGWDKWLLTALQPKNTAIGAYVGAKDALNSSLEAKKGEVTATLSYGQGALTFKNCTFTVKALDASVMGGEGSVIWTSDTYVDYPGLKPTPPSDIQSRIEAGTAFADQPNCIVKTPGSTITSMLAKKANTEQTQDELTAALSTGIDAIFNAVGTALEQKILGWVTDQLKLGVLDDNASSTAALTGELNTIVATGNANISSGMDLVSNPFDTTNAGDTIMKVYPYAAPITATVINVPPTDTLLGTSWCTSDGTHNLMGVYADGSGSTRIAIITANASNCGGTVNPPDGTVLAPKYCNGSNIEEVVADGNGGSYTKILEYNSNKCTGTGISDAIDSTNLGTATYPAANTLLQTNCIAKDLLGKYADGKGGAYNNMIQTNAASCGGTANPASGTALTSPYCSGSNLLEVEADGKGGTSVVTVKAGALQCTIANTNTSVYDPLAIAKNNAAILINSSASSEQSYQYSYLVAKTVFTQARAVFATSSACNIALNRPYSAGVRASLIQANIITNIDGLNDFSGFRTLAPINFNLIAIQTALNSVDAKLTTLKQASSDVQKATTVTAVRDAVTPVNSLSIDDPKTNIVDTVKSWLRGVQPTYNTIQCPIDLTKILLISTTTVPTK